MLKHFLFISMCALLVAGAYAQAFTGINWEVQNATIGTGLARTSAYDPVSDQVLISDQAPGNVLVFTGAAGAAGTPATMDITGLDFTQRNLFFFGIGASDAGVVYSYLNNNGNANGTGIVRWPTVAGAPTEIANNTTDPEISTTTPIFFARNLEILSDSGVDYIVEVGASDGDDIHIWSWDQSSTTFALVDSVPGDGLAGPTYGGKSGADLDAWPPNYALGCDVVGGVSNGAHLWENTSGTIPGTWSFIGNLTPPANVSATDSTPTIDVGFDTTLSGQDEPVMFAMFAPNVTADTVTIAMYELGMQTPIATIDIPTGGANPDSGGSFIVDEANNHIYYYWHPAAATDATYGRVSYQAPQAPVPPPAFLDVASAAARVFVTQEATATFTGASGQTQFRSVGYDPINDLVVFPDNSEFLASTGNNSAGILTADPNSATPDSTLAILVPSATIDAVSDAPGGASNLAYNAVRFADDGTLFLGDFGSIDEVIRIQDPGGANTATNMRSVDGQASLVITADQAKILIATETGFGGNDDVIAVSATSVSATDELIASASAIQTFTGFPLASSGSGGQLANGDLLVADRSGFGGSDNVLAFRPDGTITIIATPTQQGGYPELAGGGGIDEIAADSLGNIYMFSEDNESAIDGALVILLAQGGVATIDYSVLEAVSGGQSTLFEAEGQVAVREVNDMIYLYVANDTNQGGDIYEISFGTTLATSTDAFELYR
jgi:hypothetical protein